MGQNENIKSNGFENFEGQGKYKSISSEKERKAHILGKTALITSIIAVLLGFFCDIVAEHLLSAFINNVVIVEQIKIFLLWMSIGFEALSVCICICGLMIKRTILLKRLLVIHCLFWVSTILSFLLLYGIVGFIFGWYK